MSDQLIIANGVTLHTLNPHNFALKNDYMENLLVTAFTVFKAIVPVIGDKRFRIKRGFQSHSYIMQEVDATASSDLMRHARGQAIEFTWDNCTDEDIMIAAMAVYNQAEEPVKVIIDQESRTLYVARGVNQSVIIEKTINESRVIQKSA